MSHQAATTGWHLKQFRRELGITPGRLIQECQREMSSVLLRDTSLLVETVARLVGFKSASAQRRIYRDLAGISPSKMRDFLHLIAPEQQSVGEEVRGWYFWVRLHRGELGDAIRAALRDPASAVRAAAAGALLQRRDLRRVADPAPATLAAHRAIGGLRWGAVAQLGEAAVPALAIASAGEPSFTRREARRVLHAMLRRGSGAASPAAPPASS